MTTLTEIKPLFKTLSGELVGINNMDRIALFAGVQVLSVESGLLGVTHIKARKAITAMIGYCPKGRPNAPENFEQACAWLRISPV